MWLVYASKNCYKNIQTIFLLNKKIIICAHRKLDIVFVVLLTSFDIWNDDLRFVFFFVEIKIEAEHNNFLGVSFWGNDLFYVPAVKKVMMARCFFFGSLRILFNLLFGWWVDIAGWDADGWNGFGRVGDDGLDFFVTGARKKNGKKG